MNMTAWFLMVVALIFLIFGLNRAVSMFKNCDSGFLTFKIEFLKALGAAVCLATAVSFFLHAIYFI